MPWQLITRSLRRYPTRPPDSGIARRKSVWERIHLDPWLLGMLLVLLAADDAAHDDRLEIGSPLRQHARSGARIRPFCTVCRRCQYLPRPPPAIRCDASGQ